MGLPPEQWAFAVFVEIAGTPQVWPLDDVVYEMLLGTGGFDLSQGDHVHAALWTTALLVAVGPHYGGLYCGHGPEPSAFCEASDAANLDALYAAATDLTDEASIAPLRIQLERRCVAFGLEGPDPISDAA
jgi:hypothetical protein